MNTNKKTSIRRRLHIIVLAISSISLLITGILGIFIMISIRIQSDLALSEETKGSLKNLVESKAGMADAKLLGFREYAIAFSGYLTELHTHPRNYTLRERWIDLDASGDSRDYFVRGIRRSEDIVLEDYYDEISLDANIEDLIYPIVTDPSTNVTTVYWGNESGILIGYDRPENLIPIDFVYDFWESSWYTKCKEANAPIYTDIYTDGFGRGSCITCAAPYYDAEGHFYGAFGVDVLISDLYEECVDLDLGEGAYAFIIDHNYNIISADGSAGSVFDTEALPEETVDRLLREDSDVFLDHGIYYTSARIESTGWTLCLHVPQELASAPVRSIDRGIRMLIISYSVLFFLILMLVAFIIRKFSARLTEPLLSLTEDVKKISDGDLDHRASVRSDDEIGDLAQSFNDMTASLQGHIRDLTEVTAERERMEAELNVAARIQTDMLPTEFFKSMSFDMFASMTPAKEVGGDFYDFFYTDEDHLALVVADVSGKGVPAALFMVVAKTLLKNIAMRGGSPAKILTETNRQLCRNNESQLFVTAWFGILNLKNGEIVYTNAGHEYPAVMHKDGEYDLIRTENQLPLAAMEDCEYSQDRMMLLPGDRLFLYTDGLPEAKNNEGERYGIDRMLSALNAHSKLRAKDFLNAVKGEVDGFAKDVEPYDDLTMLAFYYKTRY